MNPQTLENLEMTDFETGESIVEAHYIIIQDPKKEELFARINTETYNKRVREVLMERRSSGLGSLERAGECRSYHIYIVNKDKKTLHGPMSKDMLKKGFQKVYEYFDGINLLN